MYDNRGNIMLRKQKPYSGRNNTSIEAEHASEQAKLDTLRNRRNNIGEQRRVAIFGSTEERANLKQRIAEDAQLQLTIKEQRIREEREWDRREHERIEQHRQMMAQMEAERERMRRERSRQVAQENKLAAIAKVSDSLVSKVSADRRDREVIEEQVARYNPNVF